MVHRKNDSVSPLSAAFPAWSRVEQVIRSRAGSIAVITQSSEDSNLASAGCILPKVALTYIYLQGVSE